MSEHEHAWELQRHQSKMHAIVGIRRYRCTICGEWGWRMAQRKWRDGSGPPESPVKPYRPAQLEPLPEWDEEAEYERAVSMSDGVASTALHGRGHGPDSYDEIERTAARMNRWPYQWKHKP